MALVLTLIEGDAQANYVEHPTEIARKALLVAAEAESPEIAIQLRRVA